MEFMETDPMEEEAAPAAFGTGQKSSIQREAPEIAEARKRLVKQIQSEVRADKARWADDFKRMKDDMEYTRLGGRSSWVKSGKYYANLIQRHVNGKVAALYAKNPKTVVRRKKRREFKMWDGSTEQLQMAMQTMQVGMGMMQQQAAMGMMGQIPGPVQEAMALASDAANGLKRREMLDGIAETLEYLHAYFVGEQNPNFKRQMKSMVRRAVTTGVGYVKIGFQRSMEMRPETANRISEIETRLAVMKQMAADIQDGEIREDDPEVERLRLEMESLRSEPEIISYEGLVFDFPQSTNIIPSRFCYQLDGFLGAPMVTEEIPMTVDQVKAIFEVDLSKSSFTPYRDGNKVSDGSVPKDKCDVMVWVTYHKDDGLVYYTVDGYEDFLKEPTAPEIKIDRFWPWFTFVLNECADPSTIYPLSDVHYLMPMQDEYNRSRQSLREHRKAALPAWVVRRQALTDDDVGRLKEKKTGSVLELDGLQPGQKVEDLLQPLKSPGIDPALYETAMVFDDFMRVGGSQEANLGGTSNSTATESSIAEASRMSGLQSNIDDMDDMLSSMARSAGQILLEEMSADQVAEIVGPGAVWPEWSASEISKEIYLEIEAGSSGRPNKAVEMSNWKNLAPVLLQTPGVKPSWFLKETIRRLDDKLDFTDAFDQNIPSMAVLNSVKQVTGAPPDADPAAQGAKGGQNHQSIPGGQNEGPAGENGLDPQMAGGMEGGPMSPIPPTGPRPGGP